MNVYVISTNYTEDLLFFFLPTIIFFWQNIFLKNGAREVFRILNWHWEFSKLKKNTLNKVRKFPVLIFLGIKLSCFLSALKFYNEGVLPTRSPDSILWLVLSSLKRSHWNPHLHIFLYLLWESKCRRCSRDGPAGDPRQEGGGHTPRHHEGQAKQVGLHRLR